MIEEGLVKIDTSNVFYNPKMKRLRDISVAFLKAMNIKNASLLDATAASGIRGIRYKIEANIDKITLLDINRNALNTIKENLKINNIDANVVIDSIEHFANSTRERFDIIDLDPFGSPVPFIYDIMKLVKDNTILMVTATDMPVLCGVDRNACIRFYGSYPLHTYLCKEVGMRILLYKIIQTAAQFDYGIEPLLGISDMYYIRVFVRLKKGYKYADNSIENLGYLIFFKNNEFSYTRSISKISSLYKKGSQISGPLWLSNLYNKDIISNMLLYTNEKIIKTINNELDIPFFYHLGLLTSSLGIGSIPIKKVIEAISSLGFNATRTQFDNMGIKSNITFDQLIKLLSNKY